MNEYSNATYVSGLTVGVVGGIYLTVNELLFFDGGFSSLLAGLLGFLLYGLAGLAFSGVLLIPLRPLFKKISLALSFLIFLLLGIVVPLIILHSLNQIHAHGIEPYSPEEISGTIAKMSMICSIGAAGALSAWYTLRRERLNHDN